MKEFVKWEKGRYEIQWNHITPVISSGVEKSSGTMLLTVSEAYATSLTVNLKSGRLTI